MSKRFGFNIFLMLCCVSASAFSNGSQVIDVGGGEGQHNVASGVSTVAIHQGSCQYSLKMGEDQHVSYSDPAIIFSESKEVPSDESTPYLEQAEMSAGYDWTFKENDKFKAEWFGLMCEDAANTNFSGSKGSADSSEGGPELALVKEGNDFKCPASLVENRWVPNENSGKPGTFIFKELAGEDWSGFIVATKGKTSGHFDRINFCLIHEKNVVIGMASDSIKPSWLGQKKLDEIIVTLKTVRFSL